jgi:hypothetical protein
MIILGFIIILFCAFKLIAQNKMMANEIYPILIKIGNKRAQGTDFNPLKSYRVYNEIEIEQPRQGIVPIKI